MADDDREPREPTHPDDLNVDRREEPSAERTDAFSARAMGDMLDDSTESLDPDYTRDIRSFATRQNENAAKQAQAEHDAQREAEAAAEAETQRSIDAEGKVRRAMMRLAVGIVAFAAVYGCAQVFGGDDDPGDVGLAVDDAGDLESAIDDVGTDTADTGVSGDVTEEAVDTADDVSHEGDESEATAASSSEGPDDLVRPRAYRAMIDPSGEAWLQVIMWGNWVGTWPEFFSGFGLFIPSWNPATEVGWEVHDGTNIVLGTTSEAYILDDGSLLFATGLFPTRPFVLSIDTRFGSWPDEAGPPAEFGEDSTSIDSELIGEGDPLVDFGAVPVFDLVANE
jgi:hypothetical protein